MKPSSNANVIRLIRDHSTGDIEEAENEIEEVLHKLSKLILRKVKLETIQRIEALIPDEIQKEEAKAEHPE